MTVRCTDGFLSSSIGRSASGANTPDGPVEGNRTIRRAGEEADRHLARLLTRAQLADQRCTRPRDWQAAEAETHDIRLCAAERK